MIGALLWDVDGTLAETERHGHLVAFNQAFEALGVPWRWSEARYGELLAVAGGGGRARPVRPCAAEGPPRRERLLHDTQGQPEAPAQPGERARLAAAAHRLKNEYSGAIVRAGRLPLR